ncbi:putative membrane protein YphA (DoxX/SURF4 family) [Inhella inkyongensis]|uniref:Putative membrane protein YphA (DoxX/SURF4 family) n=1 Tax=Inhella inkyongensis TaxID=392593 RepID=A0A840S546_9BURK|nr:DoxX family protein [Inhella inkyongensis]MBB5203630.1 putative membrane protein YphA (DoxX/SURF4 family) [Inhella inkyongensis]
MLNKIKTYLPITLLALPLLLGGGAKLAGVPELHASFGILGLPAWFGYFIGSAEVAGALGLFIPRLRRLAAAGLVPIMAGALYFHVRHTPLEQGVPALVLLSLALWVAMRRPQTEPQYG